MAIQLRNRVTGRNPIATARQSAAQQFTEELHTLLSTSSSTSVAGPSAEPENYANKAS
ncbi:unnamed protein product, partial [Amoebophrya sp. A120]|eukprot:GSA120T00016877001.1